MVMLVSLALFGEGVLGASVLDSAGLARDADARERFHAWIVRLVEAHLHGPGLVAEPTVPARAARAARGLRAVTTGLQAAGNPPRCHAASNHC